MRRNVVVAGGAFSALILGFVSFVASRPDATVVSRSVVIAATEEEVFHYVDHFDRWQQWNPWQAKDPAQVVTFSEAKEGAGAWYEWNGNDAVGHGRMTITAVDPGKKLTEKLEFFEPFAAVAEVSFTVEPVSEGGLDHRLTWTYTQQNDLGAKFGSLFVDMDAMLGADFEAGLSALVPLVEAYRLVHLEELELARAREAEQARIRQDVAWFEADGATCVLWKTRPGRSEAPEEVMRFPGRCPNGNSTAWNSWKDRFVFWDETEAWVGNLNTRAAYPVSIPTTPLDSVRWKATQLEATAQVQPESVDGQWAYEGVREAIVAGHRAVACLGWEFTGDPGAPGAKPGVDPALWSPRPPRIVSYAGLNPGRCMADPDDGTAEAFVGEPLAGAPPGTAILPGAPSWAVTTGPDRSLVTPAWRNDAGNWARWEGLPENTAIRVYVRPGFLVLCTPDRAWALAEDNGRVLWENPRCPIHFDTVVGVEPETTH